MKKVYLLLINITLSFGAFASENSLYNFSWLDPDKEIYVLQNRKFRKAGKVYIGGTVGKQTNGAFIDSYAGNLYGGFFFSEDWGLEFSYTAASGDQNATHDAVNEQGSVAYYRKITSATTGMLMWSPFYSKINTFNQIFYFDWMIGAGLSKIDTEDNRKDFGPPDERGPTLESNVAFAWMTGLRFHINESWSTRIDFTAFHLNADNSRRPESDSEVTSEKTFSHYYNINFGLNYSF